MWKKAIGLALAGDFYCRPMSRYVRLVVNLPFRAKYQGLLSGLHLHSTASDTWSHTTSGRYEQLKHEPHHAYACDSTCLDASIFKASEAKDPTNYHV